MFIAAASEHVFVPSVVRDVACECDVIVTAVDKVSLRTAVLVGTGFYSRRMDFCFFENIRIKCSTAVTHCRDSTTE